MPDSQSFSNSPLGETPSAEFGQALEWLYARGQFAMKLGLENMAALLAQTHHPEVGGCFLHVAGTNGKGSVCTNLSALLPICGFKNVGLYTSPHLVSFRERIRVNGAPIPRESVATWFKAHRAKAELIGATYFEVATAMALSYFQSQNCTAAVMETGMGGRLDATNILVPKVTVLTSISLDHMAYLGDTVEAIFAEKAAIMKPGVPMVAAERRPHLVAALRRLAAEKKCPLRLLEDHPYGVEAGLANFLEGTSSPSFVLQGYYRRYVLPAHLRVEVHQQENLALSLLALEAFLGHALPDDALVAQALWGARMPGRTQILTAPGYLPLMLDGAHNPEGIQAMVRAVKTVWPQRKVRALFAIMSDKDHKLVFAELQSLCEEIVWLPLWESFPRALDPRGRYAEGPFPDLTVEGLRPWLLEGSGADAVLVCGSLYLLGEVIPLLLDVYPGLEGFRELAEDPRF